MCAAIQQQEHCNHNDEERAFGGTWVTDYKKAMEKGYKVLKIC